MIVELLTLGNELLDGRRIDTNAAWIGRFLSGYGLQVRYHQTTLDLKQDIVDAFRLALSRSDLIISTGGLGPTQDDITFEGVAEVVNQKLKYHPDIFNQIQKKYEKRGIPCPQSNKRQAMLPESATPIEAVGTAPGIFLEVSGKMIFCFPGVPTEMEGMIKNFFVPKIQAKINANKITQVGFSISGIAEALIEEKMQKLGLDQIKNADAHIAYTASQSTVDITYSLTPHDPNKLEQIVGDINQRFTEAFSANLIKWNDKTIEEHIVEWFLSRKKMLGLAESITGGLITSNLVAVPGCSGMLERGVVSYSYSSKMDLLDVSQKTLAEFGAVSPECVLEMARGLRKRSKADITLSICGIAGPGGATDKKPLGLTYICWVGPKLENKTYVKSTEIVGPNIPNPDMNKKASSNMVEDSLFHDNDGLAKVQGFVFSGDRKRNRMLAANQALMGLYSFIKQYEE